MEAHHASQGRRRLEEIRQKRAAERLSKAPSGFDLQADGMHLSASRDQISEKDFHVLLSQIKDLEKKSSELENENKILTSKLEVKTVETDSLQKRSKDLEENSLPSLRKALKEALTERDAAIMAREDISAQLRTAKKRLKEAEEEQYRAEEDAASLRAEINMLQQQGMTNSLVSIPSISHSPDHIQAMEKEISDLKDQIQQLSSIRHQELQRLSDEQLRVSVLMAEKEELNERLSAFSKKVSEEEATRKAFSVQEKGKLEKQLHDMAVMVERLESGRQKLLAEIDSQSSEIEGLFEENTSLSASYKDAMVAVVQLENQVKDCLKQNEDLRRLLDKLRTDQASILNIKASDAHLSMESEGKSGDTSITESYKAEVISVKGQLAKEQSRVEALNAEVMRLSVELKHATLAHQNLTRMYKPVLRKIENGLINMKQENFVAAR